jgi:uncharacterized iron-regulated membrane protein
MKLFRKVIFWCHLAAGVAAGVVILIMSVTGVLLTYERQVQRRADLRGYNVSRPAADAARLPVEALLSRAQEAQRAAPSGFTLYGDAASPATVSFPGGRVLYVNPYTGEALGEGSVRVRAFFRFVTDWHRWLGASGEGRTTGGQQQQQGANTPVPLEGLDGLLVRAERQVEGWRGITLQLPVKPDAPAREREVPDGARADA